MLNIPENLLAKLKTKQNVLLLGVGGGFDIYSGLPLYYTLRQMNINVHLANYSFTDFEEVIKNCEPIIINNNLIGANDLIKQDMSYYPEGYLSKFLSPISDKGIIVWAFRKTGVIPLQYSLRELIARLNIDCIILIDGGVDSLNTGDEEGSGTLLEDSIVIASLVDFDIDKYLMCIGFGTEVEENVCGYNVLRNISEIIKENGFYGSCSLTKDMKSYLLYKNACYYTFNLPFHSTSHIHRRIIPAIEGEFDDFHSTSEDMDTKIFISAFMSIVWFFDYQVIYNRNKVIPYISASDSFYQAVQDGVPYIKNTKKYEYNVIPY